MKKLVSLLTALVLAALLCACGAADTNTPDRGTVQPGFDSAASGQLQQGVTEEGGEDGEVSSGSVSGGVYTSSFVGVGCTLDDSWTFYAADELEALTGALSGQSEGGDLRTLLERSSAVYDMYAASNDGLMSINAVYQNLGLLGGSTVSPQEYVELSVEQLPPALTACGFEDVEAAVTSVDFAGQEGCCAVDITAQLGDTPMYEQVICLKTGSYIYCVTLCSFTQNVTADMAALFYGL